MANPKNHTPHTRKDPDCKACLEDATKYNHCVGCGRFFRSHSDLLDHFRYSNCGILLLKWLKAS